MGLAAPGSRSPCCPPASFSLAVVMLCLVVFRRFPTLVLFILTFLGGALRISGLGPAKLEN